MIFLKQKETEKNAGNWPIGFIKPYLKFFLGEWTGPRSSNVKESLMNQCLISLNILKKTFKRYSGQSPDSFKDHQNDPLLNLAFLEGLDEELVTLIKQHKLNRQTTHADELALLADQLSKTIQKKKKDKVTQIMNLQLQQVSNQASSYSEVSKKRRERSLFLLQKARAP